MKPIQYYTAGLRLMDLHSIMDRVQDNGETAIVHDISQSIPGGPKGAYYDAYVDGRLLCAFHTQAEAEEAIRREQRG